MILFWLIVAHYVADFPLQGDFLARGKDRHHPFPGVPWWHCLLAHSIIQGGAVALITGYPALGIAEATCHFAIDEAKCDGALDFNGDQIIHLVSKLAWFIAAMFWR